MAATDAEYHQGQTLVMAELHAAADAQRPVVEAAEAKRQRKALKRQRDANRQRGILECLRNTCL